MRNLPRRVLAIISLILLSGCQEKNQENKSDTSTIKEKTIERRNEVVIKVNDTIDSFFTNLFVDEMQEKPDMLYLGQEERKTYAIIPTQTTIKIIGGDPFISFFYELQLERGDSLLIDIKKIDVNQSKQIEYPIFTIVNGNETWSETNFDYLLYKYNIDNQAIVIDAENFRENRYEAKEIFLNAIELLDSLKASSCISETFYSVNKTNQRLKLATYKIREAKNQNVALDIESLGIDLNDEKLLDHVEYVSFLKAMVLYKYFKKDKRVKNSVLFDFVYEQKTFLNGSAKEVLLDSYLKSILFTEKSEFEKYLKKFHSVNTDDRVRNKWNSFDDKQKAKSKKLNATNRNVGILTNLVNDTELTFEQVLAKHKGKVILVDFWASWCSPCRKEMPFLTGLKQKFNENELEIIGISIDGDYAAWERASRLENLSKEEENYIISNWKESNLYKNYRIETIPRYLLFDQNGKILNDDAPRPSEYKLEELIRANT